MSESYLIIQTAFLGDVILMEPLIETIKLNRPDAYIAVMVIPQNKDVFFGNPSVDKIITYDKHGSNNGLFGLINIIKEVRKYNFDYAISPHTSFRTSLFVLFSKIKRRIGFHEADLNIAYTDLVKKPKDVHEIYKNISLIQPLNFKKINSKIKLYYTKDNENFFDGIKEAHGIKNEDKVVGISPSSVWPTKRWPKEKFFDLAKKLADKGLFIVLFGTKKDSKITQYIQNGSSRIIDLAGKTNLKDLFCIISKINLLITNDSAPVHIASAYNTPTIDIFGPTSPLFGFAPLSEKNKILEVSGLKCRPCNKHGSVSCKYKHFKCMVDIDVDQVYEAASELL